MKQIKKPHQKLDEHGVGVAHNAYLLACTVPNLHAAMPAITRHPTLKKRTTDPHIGCRFSVALGLRTLTLQTGDALKERLKLEDDDSGSDWIKRR